MSTNNEAGERMTLPKAISDAIDNYDQCLDWHGLARAALERAIAEDRLRQVHIELLCASAQADVAGYLAQRMREVLDDHDKLRRDAVRVADAGKMVPVDAPTEAEIEAWSGRLTQWVMRQQEGIEHTDGESLVSILRHGQGLMRRAAAAKPFYDPMGKGGTHDFAMHIDPAGTVRGVTFTLTDKTTGVVTRYVPEQAAATPAPSALERLFDRIAKMEVAQRGRVVQAEVLNMIDEEREREAGHG